MTFKFDHIIHYVNDAYEVKEEVGEKGLHVVVGGRHEHRGTYNTLLHFDLSYIEYLAIDDRKCFEEVKAADIKYSPFSTIAEQEYQQGFSRVALRTKNLPLLAERFKQKGFHVNGPVPLSRKRPDGSVLEWSLLFVHDPKTNLPLPFFIDWLVTDDERRKELVNQGVIKQHDIGSSRLSGVYFAVEELKRTVNRWEELLDTSAEAPFEDSTLGASVQKIELEGGDLYFFSPSKGGVIEEIIQESGEGPFLVSIKNDRIEDEVDLRNGTYQFYKR
ncbi:VOC family protein [Alteribacter aurantiacus]|uniref:VOC family protein n=1 Tax=Alteribacter aurantiacus TaxID=254410 RepID=UPI0003FF1CA5|nr:VOC family protein [Alteribacter aurantiacus]